MSDQNTKLLLLRYLRSLLYPFRDPTSPHRRGDSASSRNVDDADGSQPDNGRVGYPQARPVSHPRPRHEVLCHLSTDARCSRYPTCPLAAEVAMVEGVCGALDSISENGSTFADDSVWRTIASSCAV